VPVTVHDDVWLPVVASCSVLERYKVSPFPEKCFLIENLRQFNLIRCTIDGKSLQPRHVLR
jgi:hypothetical protein